jgi:hypothetical protein
MKKPSLTELLDLLNKPALLKWANKQGLQGIDISIDRTRRLQAGTSIHKQIENFNLHGTPFESPTTETNYRRFIYGKEILDMEHEIETEWFTGRIDMRYKDMGNTYIVDFKNNCKRVYLENLLQLIGYSIAKPCDRLAIISVPTFTVFHVNVKDRKPYEEILKALSIVYQNKKIVEYV